jgi:hypothetical protein
MVQHSDVEFDFRKTVCKTCKTNNQEIDLRVWNGADVY